MGKSAPSQPDPVATANAQGAANAEAVRESARVNAVDQITPYGNVTYTKDADGVPTQQVTTLNPSQQQVLDQQNQLGVYLAGLANQQSQYLPTEKYDLQQFGNVPTSADYGAQGADVRKAVYDQAVGLLSPQFEQQNRAVAQEIENRGIPYAGEAALTLRNNQQNQQNQQLQQAANNAVLSGYDVQNQLFGQDLTSRQQGINEYTSQYQTPFNTVSALTTGTPVYGAPQASLPSYQVAPSDVQGAIYQNYNAANQNYQNRLGGLYGLLGTAGGAAIMASDRRLKRMIEPIGKMEKSGLTVYRYQYKCSKKWQVGVMADEVKEVYPDAVVKGMHGYDMVDYSKVY